MLDKYISIFFSILIFFNGYLIKKVFKTWLFPSSLYCLFWFGYTFFPLVFVNGVLIEPLSLLYIYISSLIMTVSTFFFKWEGLFKSNKLKDSNTFKNLTIRRYFYVLSILSLLFLFINSYIQGFSINDLIFNFFESSAEYTSKRYSEEIISNPFAQLSNIFTYTSLPLGGILLILSKKTKEKFLILSLSFLPTVLIMITQSSKGALFLALALFYAGVLIIKIFENDFMIVNKKSLKIFFYSLCFIAPLTIVSFISRGLYGDEYGYEFIINSLKFSFSSYSFGHLYAFSDWFSFYIGKMSVNTYKSEDYTFGFYTFMPVFYFFGSEKKIPLGVFDEYLKYDEILQTNIYTWFRGLILDFGLTGSLLFLFLFGLLLNKCFHSLLSNKNSEFSISIYVFMIGFFYTSFIISLLIWKSIYASILLLFLVFKINSLKVKKTLL